MSNARKKQQRRVKPLFSSPRKPREQAQFPFRMLTMWMKSYPSQGKPCNMCGKAACFVIEQYIDLAQLVAVQDDPIAHARRLDQLWARVVAEQMAGIYSRADVSYHCKACAFEIVKQTVGENAGRLAMMGSVLAPHLSIILGNTLLHAQDEGLPFATVVDVRLTINEVARQVNDNPTHIQLKMDKETSETREAEVQTD